MNRPTCAVTNNKKRGKEIWRQKDLKALEEYRLITD